MIRLFFLTLLALSFPVYAADSPAEKILLFDSHIIINENASLDITETISLSGHAPLLTRKLPLVSDESSYKINQVLINNVQTAYQTKSENGQFSIAIENKNDLPLNIYIIQYHAENITAITNKTNLLNWNVTGNSFTYPIYKVDTDINLPDASEITQYSGSTGTTKKPKQGFYAKKPSPNKLTYTTTQPLLPEESLNITLSWQNTTNSKEKH